MQILIPKIEIIYICVSVWRPTILECSMEILLNSLNLNLQEEFLALQFENYSGGAYDDKVTLANEVDTLTSNS